LDEVEGSVHVEVVSAFSEPCQYRARIGTAVEGVPTGEGEGDGIQLGIGELGELDDHLATKLVDGLTKRGLKPFVDHHPKTGIVPG
jgi:hypothetical protein